MLYQNQTNTKKPCAVQPWIMQRADPYVYRHTDGMYYFTASVPEYDRIILRRGKSLQELADAEEAVLWRRHESGIMSCHIWAPELHYLNNAWYIYFAAGAVEDIWAIRPYVIRCTGEDPMTGRWEELGQIQPYDEFTFQDFSLDMTVFTHREKLYAVWAEKVSVGKKISNLYIAEMETPWKLGTQQVLLSSPDYNWEREDFWVNEGPAVIRHGERLFLTYSASATGACYCMGLLSIGEDQDLLDPENWEKSRQPVFLTQEEAGIYGPGHNSFTVDETGNADICVYHARPYRDIVGDPLYDPNRHAYLMKMKWDERGYPVFTPAL